MNLKPSYSPKFCHEGVPHEGTPENMLEKLPDTSQLKPGAKDGGTIDIHGPQLKE